MSYLVQVLCVTGIILLTSIATIGLILSYESSRDPKLKAWLLGRDDER